MIKSLIWGVSVSDLRGYRSGTLPKEQKKKKCTASSHIINSFIALQFLCVLSQFSSISKPFIL